MTTTPKDDFAGASPRPWKRDPSFASIRDMNQQIIVDCMGDHTSELQDFDNADLVVAAVNAYDPDRDAKLRDALNAAYSHLMNLQPTIANTIIAEHRPFIDNKVNPAMQQIESALALLPEETTDGQ